MAVLDVEQLFIMNYVQNCDVLTFSSYKLLFSLNFNMKSFSRIIRNYFDK